MWTKWNQSRLNRLNRTKVDWIGPMQTESGQCGLNRPNSTEVDWIIPNGLNRTLGDRMDKIKPTRTKEDRIDQIEPMWIE